MKATLLIGAGLILFILFRSCISGGCDRAKAESQSLLQAMGQARDSGDIAKARIAYQAYNEAVDREVRACRND
jgi:hypothetical protein